MKVLYVIEFQDRESLENNKQASKIVNFLTSINNNNNAKNTKSYRIISYRDNLEKSNNIIVNLINAKNKCISVKV